MVAPLLPTGSFSRFSLGMFCEFKDKQIVYTHPTGTAKRQENLSLFVLLYGLKANCRRLIALLVTGHTSFMKACFIVDKA